MDSQTIIAEARGHLNAWRELPFRLKIAPSTGLARTTSRRTCNRSNRFLQMLSWSM